MSPVPDPRAQSAVIADDEVLARRRIAALLREHPGVSIVSECATGPATVAAVRELGPDLLFLDVQMPGLSGFEVLAALRPEERPVVIFSTAYDEYALAAFEVHAVDYLLKPYADERFHEALRRAQHALRAERMTAWHDGLRTLLEAVDTPAPARSAVPGRLERFAVRHGERVALVDTSDVDWIEAARDYVRLHVGRDAHVVRGTIGDLEQRLDPARFARIHRSTIVQLCRVTELIADPPGDYTAVLAGGTRLRVSRRYRDALLCRLGVRW